MASTSVRLTIEFIETEHGLWCEDCALPSVERAVFMAKLGDADFGPVMAVKQCRDCGQRTT